MPVSFLENNILHALHFYPFVSFVQFWLMQNSDEHKNNVNEVKNWSLLSSFHCLFRPESSQNEWTKLNSLASQKHLGHSRHLGT